MTKPFRFEELLARVRALRDERTVERTVLKAGAIAPRPAHPPGQHRRRTIDLTAREFTMLEVLIRHAGQVLAREQCSRTSGATTTTPAPTWSTYFGYLRKKLGSSAIGTVRGMGYRLMRKNSP